MNAQVLIVDDEIKLAEALRRLLREHDVVATSDAAEALAWVAAGRRFDAILSDVKMPLMSGVEFYSRLLQSCPEQAARVVFMTGGVTTPDERTFVDAMGDRVLFKPATISQVREHLARLLMR